MALDLGLDLGADQFAVNMKMLKLGARGEIRADAAGVAGTNLVQVSPEFPTRSPHESLPPNDRQERVEVRAVESLACRRWFLRKLA